MEALTLLFNQKNIALMKNLVECNRVDGVEIDEAELSSLEEMMKEASK